MSNNRIGGNRLDLKFFRDGMKWIFKNLVHLSLIFYDNLLGEHLDNIENLGDIIK